LNVETPALMPANVPAFMYAYLRSVLPMGVGGMCESQRRYPKHFVKSELSKWAQAPGRGARGKKTPRKEASR
jgi:hypothetical protein